MLFSMNYSLERISVNPVFKMVLFTLLITETWEVTLYIHVLNGKCYGVNQVNLPHFNALRFNIE